jgi:anti-sigma factor RsiW
MTDLDRLSARDLEKLSAFLDGQLSSRESEQVEARLEQDTKLRQALEDLRRTSEALASLPEVRPPRNFTLSEQMVGSKARGRAYPLLQLSTVLAGLAFFVVVGADLLTATSARNETMLSEAEFAAEPLQRAADAEGELQIEAEQDLAAAPAAPAETGQEFAAGELPVEELAAAAEQETEEEETPSSEEAAPLEDSDLTEIPEDEPDGQATALPGEPATQQPEELATPQGEERAALTPTTPEPLGSPAPAALESPPVTELGDTAADELEPEPELFDEPAADDSAAVSEASQPSISLLRIAEIGLGAATLLLLGLTIWVRVRG